MSPTVIGLVGGIASGKSSVAAHFSSERSTTVVDADVLARRVLGQPAVKTALDRRFPGMLAKGSLDRQKMASHVFSRPGELAALEAILHPPIGRALRAAIRRARTAYVLVDAPLLLETGLGTLCDWVVYVACPARTRRRRASTTRGWSEAEHRSREARQWSLRSKRAASDLIVDNGSSPERCRRDVRRAVDRMERKRRRIEGKKS